MVCVSNGRFARKDCITRSMLSGGLARGQDMVSLIEHLMSRCEVSGRMTNSRKCGLGGSGSADCQFDEGLNREMWSWKDGQFQDIWSCALAAKHQHRLG